MFEVRLDATLEINASRPVFRVLLGSKSHLIQRDLLTGKCAKPGSFQRRVAMSRLRKKREEKETKSFFEGKKILEEVSGEGNSSQNGFTRDIRIQRGSLSELLLVALVFCDTIFLRGQGALTPWHPSCRHQVGLAHFKRRKRENGRADLEGGGTHLGQRKHPQSDRAKAGALSESLRFHPGDESSSAPPPLSLPIPTRAGSDPYKDPSPFGFLSR